jgi:hypothetical protein
VSNLAQAPNFVESIFPLLLAHAAQPHPLRHHQHVITAPLDKQGNTKGSCAQLPNLFVLVHAVELCGNNTTLETLNPTPMLRKQAREAQVWRSSCAKYINTQNRQGVWHIGLFVALHPEFFEKKKTTASENANV